MTTMPASIPEYQRTCNGIDDNCDGLIDEGVKTTYFADSDGDGYGDVSSDTLNCSLPLGICSQQPRL